MGESGGNNVGGNSVWGEFRGGQSRWGMNPQLSEAKCTVESNMVVQNTLNLAEATAHSPPPPSETRNAERLWN